MRKSFKNTNIIDRETFQNAVDAAECKADVIVALGFTKKGTHGYRRVNYYSELYGIPLPIASGSRHTQAARDKQKIQLDDILDGKHPMYATSALRVRLIEDGRLPAKCDICGIVEWNGKPAPLVLDHINGVSWDHRFANLRILCRNCDGQTDTFCGKNNARLRREARVAEKTERRNAKLISGEMRAQNEHDIRFRDGHLVEKVLKSGIDFQSSGWVTQVAPIINQAPQKVRKWMSYMMPEFLETCYVRKSPDMTKMI